MRTAAIILALHALSAQASIGYTERKDGTCSPFYTGGYACSSCSTQHFHTSNCDGLCYAIYTVTVTDDGAETRTCTQRCGSAVN